MSMQQEQTRPRRLVQSCNESVASLAKRNGSPCQQGDDYQGVKTMRNPWAFLPEVSQTRMEHDVISEDSSHLRQMPGHHHDTIKNVKIMVELTCHILENATSLEGLTLDTIFDGNNNPADRLSVHEVGRCGRIHSPMVMEAKNALLAIERYIVGKVPSTVKLDVLKPCSWCHTNSSVE
ncbi:Os05g0535300 [Oryza sativa Japonica Group]|uniref:Os05g0535300 protein n=1 Tax=Oryza sativa subsp. japonica TaxID=39947 RepID=Q0DGF4_ORYSJ|nr:Os05g0535300 [Oryza sativa Japonica Group]|eukprot:NP_001056155.2 Os05g0535300 [Oryza sativa Japonica Group]